MVYGMTPEGVRFGHVHKNLIAPVARRPVREANGDILQRFPGMREISRFEDWAAIEAPGAADIERLADAAFARLPERFRRLCEGLVIQVEDFPDEETLQEMGAESEFDLLGLFRGRGLAQGSAFGETGTLPNMIWLYRRPLLDYWCEGTDSLGAVVTHVLVHEIGHHFGLSDEDIEAIEASAA
jgi:predicted Zn-dependent protease with MMP-like domain